MNIRRMKPSDFKKVCEIFIDYYKEYEDEEFSFESFNERLTGIYNKPGSVMLVLEEFNSIFGFSSGYLVNQGDIVAFYLDEILVMKDFQGFGFGEKLLLETESVAKGKGANVVQLTCINDSKHNKFYNKLNYEDTKSFVIKHKWLI